MEIPVMIDNIQEFGNSLEVPEIRVWCHPHYADAQGKDYYKVFTSFDLALDFIKDNSDVAEEVPLIAFRGYEINIFDIKPFKREEGDVR